jgi:hypothetical protein
MALPTLALSQTTGTAPAKPAAKKAAPAPKAKVVLMTRDQLRACYKAKTANSAENLAVEEEKTAFQQERNEIIASKDAMMKQTNALDEKAKAILAERAELVAAQKEFEKPVSKDEAKAAEVRRLEFNERAAAHDRRIEAFNTEKQPFTVAKQALDARIEANNARGKALIARTEKYNDAIDEWRADCSNKPYDVADEAAVKKELQIK